MTSGDLCEEDEKGRIRISQDLAIPGQSFDGRDFLLKEEKEKSKGRKDWRRETSIL